MRKGYEDYDYIPIEIIHMAAADDANAYAMIIERYLPYAEKYIEDRFRSRGIKLPWADTEDILQNLWIKLCKDIHSLSKILNDKDTKAD